MQVGTVPLHQTLSTDEMTGAWFQSYTDKKISRQFDEIKLLIINKIAIYFVNLKSRQINFTKYIAMISRDEITEIFCMSDDFCKLYDRFIKANGLAPKRDKSKRKYHRDPRMSSAEIIIIMILFHLSGYKCFKHFYINEVQEHMTDIFPKTVAYNRFTELERTVVIQFILFVKRCCMGKCTGWQDRQARCKHRQELSKSAGT